MTRPRRGGFGEQPGRLAATMLRALSAELSEPGRYSRGKGYARDGAVIDIVIRPGEVVGEVLGSRREPYRVSLLADSVPLRGIPDTLTAAASVVALIPDRAEISVQCSCPDAEGGVMCKHAIAVLLVFADEVSIEPELLARWRGGPIADGVRHAGGDGHVEQVRDDRPDRVADRAQRVDVLAPMLTSPTPLPPLPNLRSLTPHPITTPATMRTAHTDLFDQLLAEALSVISRRREPPRAGSPGR
jgi:uncharacterized Zn finger protein